MKIYHYDKNNVLIASSDARPDPVTAGRYLVPRMATDIAPPAVANGEIPCFIAGAGVVQKDYRGDVIYTTADGEE